MRLVPLHGFIVPYRLYLTESSNTAEDKKEKFSRACIRLTMTAEFIPSLRIQTNNKTTNSSIARHSLNTEGNLESYFFLVISNTKTLTKITSQGKLKMTFNSTV